MLLPFPKSIRSFFAPQSVKAPQSATRWPESTHKFDKAPIRVVHVDAHPWVVDEDLLAVLHEEPTPALAQHFAENEYGVIPGTDCKGFTQAGALRLLAESTHYNAINLDLWLQRKVFAPRKKRSDA